MGQTNKETFTSAIGKAFYEHRVPKSRIYSYSKFCAALQVAFHFDDYHLYEFDQDNYFVTTWKQHDLFEKLKSINDNGLIYPDPSAPPTPAEPVGKEYKALAPKEED